MPRWRKLHVKTRQSLDINEMPDDWKPRRCWNRIIRGLQEPETAIIYALVDPDSSEIRYIGKTHCEPRSRLHLHLSEARKGNTTPKAVWMRGLLAQDKRPQIVILEKIIYPVWPETERRWLKAAREAGCALLNVQGAGGGP